MTGEFVAGSVEGNAILCDLWEEKSNSKPPLQIVSTSWTLYVRENMRDIREFNLDRDR